MVDRLRPVSADEERDIVRAMASLARTTPAPDLPGSDVIWLKAQLVRRWELERRVERPLDAMQSLHLGLGLVAAVVMLVWSAPLLLRSLTF